EKSKVAGFVSNEHAIALECAREGAAVVIASLDAEAAARVADAVEVAGGRAAAVQCDVRDEQSCCEAVRTTVDRFGALHLLVNTVGAPDLSNVLDLSREAFAASLVLNVGR